MRKTLSIFVSGMLLFAICFSFANIAKATSTSGTIKVCHATGLTSPAYYLLTVTNEPTYGGHKSHINDIIPAARSGCPGKVYNIADLSLSTVCTLNSAATRKWKIYNPNVVGVPFTWELVGTSQKGSGVVLPGSKTVVETNTVSGANTLKIAWRTSSCNILKTNSKSNIGTQCVTPTPTPTPTSTPTPTPTPTISPTPSPTPTIQPSSSPSPTPTPKPTLTPAILGTSTSNPAGNLPTSGADDYSLYYIALFASLGLTFYLKKVRI